VVGAKVEGTANFIDFENYDVGGAGKAYYDMDTKNQGGEYREDRVDVVAMKDDCGDGYAIGYTQKGEWLEYTVNVQAGGALPFELSYATGSETTGVQFFMDDKAITDTLALIGTGDWDTYAIFKGKTKELSKGEHVFKVLITGDYVNLDWIAFGETEGGAAEKRCATTSLPKFAQNAAAFARTAGEYKVFDLMGHQLGKVSLDAGATLTDIKTGLKTAGYQGGAYVIRNAAGQTLRINFGR
jgi:hypothetical protein